MSQFAFDGPDPDHQHYEDDREYVVYINGYGAPRSPVTDPACGRYLGAVFQELDQLEAPVRRIWLCGGVTNNPDLSEAAAMRAWIETHKPHWFTRVRLIEDTTTLQTNLEAFTAKYAVSSGDFHFLFFGEESRRWKMWFHVVRLFGIDTSTHVIGIPFDKRSLEWKQLCKERLVAFPLEVAATFFPRSAGWLRRYLRERHVRKERERLAKS